MALKYCQGPKCHTHFTRDRRKGTWTKPNTDKEGKHFISKEGKHCFIYWDLDATPNDNGNQWRMATDPMRVRI